MLCGWSSRDLGVLRDVEATQYCYKIILARCLKGSAEIQGGGMSIEFRVCLVRLRPRSMLPNLVWWNLHRQNASEA